MATGSREENADPASARLAEVVRIEAVVEPKAPPAPIVGPLPKAGSRAASPDRLPAACNIELLYLALGSLCASLWAIPFVFSGRMLPAFAMTPTRRHDPLNHAR